MATSFKYGMLVILLVTGCCVYAQTTSNQAIVTIVGDPVQADINNSNSNPYANNTAPPTNQQISSPKTIEPTLENGFHIRFEVEDQYINHGGSTSYSSFSPYSSSDNDFTKSKKHSATLTETSFNLKKRLRTWLPEKKKKYRPHLCGRF